jgi:hypothetical protein
MLFAKDAISTAILTLPLPADSTLYLSRVYQRRRATLSPSIWCMDEDCPFEFSAKILEKSNFRDYAWHINIKILY